MKGALFLFKVGYLAEEMCKKRLYNQGLKYKWKFEQEKMQKRRRILKEVVEYSGQLLLF